MIEAYFTDTVSHLVTTRDQFGKETRTPADRRCRVERKMKIVKTFAGETATSPMQVWFAPNVTVGPSDKIIVDGVAHDIISVSWGTDWIARYKEIGLA